jgi:hypothetical protein
LIDLIALSWLYVAFAVGLSLGFRFALWRISHGFDPQGDKWFKSHKPKDWWKGKN